jgi:hypothetical protein
MTFLFYDKLGESVVAACRDGDLTEVKKLCTKPIDPMMPTLRFNLNYMSDLPFRMACACGYLEIAKWLYQYGLETEHFINIHALSDNAFRDACINGHLIVAEWLVELSGDYKLNIHGEENGNTFRWICYHSQNDPKNQLKVAKWLYELSKTNDYEEIYLRGNDDKAFMNACLAGNLEIAKWLYELSNETINVRMLDCIDREDTIFILCCQYSRYEKENNKYFEVVKWLCEIEKHYSYFVDDDDDVKEVHPVIRTCKRKNDDQDIVIAKKPKCLECKKKVNPVKLRCGHEVELDE